MNDVVTDLLGEVVEIHSPGIDSMHSIHSLRGRGTVRAVYVASGHLHVLLENNLGFDSPVRTDRAQGGGFEEYTLKEWRARVVRRCRMCGAWDEKRLLFQREDLGDLAVELGKLRESSWTHKSGEGCNRVGHGG